MTFVREYVEKGMNEEGRNPLGDVYGGVILGRKGFIKQALGTLGEDALDQEEIARRRELRKFEMEDVIGAVCSYSKSRLIVLQMEAKICEKWPSIF